MGQVLLILQYYLIHIFIMILFWLLYHYLFVFLLDHELFIYLCIGDFCCGRNKISQNFNNCAGWMQYCLAHFQKFAHARNPVSGNSPIWAMWFSCQRAEMPKSLLNDICIQFLLGFVYIMSTHISLAKKKKKKSHMANPTMEHRIFSIYLRYWQWHGIGCRWTILLLEGHRYWEP